MLPGKAVSVTATVSVTVSDSDSVPVPETGPGRPSVLWSSRYGTYRQSSSLHQGDQRRR